MVKVTCAEVDASMPAPLRKRVTALLIARGSDAMECRWEGSAPSAQELLEAVTSHVQEFHAMRSWPPEYWIHVKACIRGTD